MSSLQRPLCSPSRHYNNGHLFAFIFPSWPWGLLMGHTTVDGMGHTYRIFSQSTDAAASLLDILGG